MLRSPPGCRPVESYPVTVRSCLLTSKQPGRFCRAAELFVKFYLVKSGKSFFAKSLVFSHQIINAHLHKHFI